jgi:CheY-like chemotaxis protein
MTTASLGDKRILVVEDHAFVRALLARFLRDAGAEVVEAADGSEALDALFPPPELILCDLGMEPMGGVEFIAALRDRAVMAPVIVVTGESSEDAAAELAGRDIAAVLTKPVGRDALLGAAARALQPQP